MTIASHRQVTKRRPAGTNFLLHSMRITNSAVVAAWRFRPLPSGVAEELTSVSNLNGTFSNVTFPFDNHSPAGLHCPLFNGSSSTVDLFSAALASAIDMTEISVSIWARVASASVFSDSTKRVIIHLGADANNLLEISRSTSNDVIDFDYTGASTADTVAASTLPTGETESLVTWMHIGLTVSDTNDEMKAYLNGSQVGSTQSGIGTFSGSIDSDLSLLGSSALGTPADVWSGGISDLIIYSDILTANEMLALANVP